MNIGSNDHCHFVLSIDDGRWFGMEDGSHRSFCILVFCRLSVGGDTRAVFKFEFGGSTLQNFHK